MQSVVVYYHVETSVAVGVRHFEEPHVVVVHAHQCLHLGGVIAREKSPLLRRPVHETSVLHVEGASLAVVVEIREEAHEPPILL